MGSGIGEELYTIAHKKNHKRFIDVLVDISQNTTVDARQLDILIKIDFFSVYGNQRELLRISDLYYNTFKKGKASKVSRQIIDGTPLEPIVQKYAVGQTKSGGVAKSYTLLDIKSILDESEDAIKSAGLEDLSDILKVRNFKDAMGYVGYISSKQEDRRKLYVLDMYPVCRKKDGKQFGYSIITKSIGSGKECRMTVFNRVYDKEPFKKDDIIYCRSFEKDGAYFTLTNFTKIY